LAVVKWVLQQAKDITIIIGSMQEYGQKRHPLDFNQRREIIQNSLNAQKITNYRIIGIVDF